MNVLPAHENPPVRNTVQPPVCAYPWSPDAGDGLCRNPVICADYSDPDVIRVGEDFYLVSSSFNCTPGLPILHSRDLIHWTIINHALKNLPHPRYAQVQPGCGVWAPSIRFHAGKFWIFFPTPDEGIYVVSADHPASPWSEPHLVAAGRGLIDPCPLWDDDGQAYLVHAYAGSRAGIKHRLRVCPMAPDGSRLLGEGRIVFHEPEKHPTIEGPKFLKRDGRYYILAPAGGVTNGWQVALRSREIYGPYEDKIVLAQGTSPVNGPHQGALVDTPGGSWWFVHFQDTGVYGRITHLQPVMWRDGWPLMGEIRNAREPGEPVLNFPSPLNGKSPSILTPQTSDEFNGPVLGRQWQWYANHQDNWHSLEPGRGLRLVPQIVPDGNLAHAPNLLLQKFPAQVFAVETEMDFSSLKDGEEAGLVVMGRTYAALSVRCDGGGRKLVYRRNNGEEILLDLPGSTIELRLEVRTGGRCRFFFGEVATSEFQATAGQWIGAKTGVYALRRPSGAGNGQAWFRYFRFLPL